MEPAHHHWHTPLAIFRRDLVRPLGGVRLDADRHQIGRLVERNLFHPVVVKFHVHVRRREPRDRRRRQRFHLPRADIFLPRPPADAGMDDRQFHSRFPAGLAASAGRDFDPVKELPAKAASPVEIFSEISESSVDACSRPMIQSQL